MHIYIPATGAKPKSFFCRKAGYGDLDHSNTDIMIIMIHHNSVEDNTNFNTSIGLNHHMRDVMGIRVVQATDCHVPISWATLTVYVYTLPNGY